MSEEHKQRSISATETGQQKLLRAKDIGLNCDGRRLTYPRIAEMAHVEKKTVERFIREGKAVYRDIAYAICTVLGLEITDVVDPDEWNRVKSSQSTSPLVTTIHSQFSEKISSESLSMLQLKKHFTEFMNKLGFEFWTYIQLDNNHLKSQGREIIEVISNYPNYWVEHYLDKDYQGIDPIINQGVNKPQTWCSDTILQKSTNPQQKQLFHDAQEIGIYLGCTIPIISPISPCSYSQFVTLVSKQEVSNWEQDCPDVSPMLTSLAYQFHNKIYQIKKTNRPELLPLAMDNQP